MPQPAFALDLLRAVHIAAGFTALFVAPGAMIARKGGTWHRRWGRVYVWAMGIVTLSAVGLAIARPNPLLLMVAVFSFYLAFSGVRVLRRKRPSEPGQRLPGASLDWAAAGLTLVGGLGLLALAMWPLGAGRGVSAVPLVFGGLAIGLAARDVRSFLRPPADPRAWWYQHMGNMLGAYIATVSAFSVVNFTALPPAARFLWPTVVGSPLIAIWTRYYKRRFAGGRTRARPATRARA